jgi:hypothetical protein
MFNQTNEDEEMLPTNSPRYISPKEGCVRWGCSRAVLYRLLGDGCLKAKKLGPKLTLIDVDAGDKYFDGLPDAKIKQDKHRSRLLPPPVNEEGVIGE